MTLAELSPLLLLAFVHLLAAMSPGATFLVVSRQALASGRRVAMAGALGCGLGALPWAIAAILGLALVLQQAQWLYAVLKLAGGLYLLYLAVMVWRHADGVVAVASEGTRSTSGQALRETFFTQLANPKVAVFFASIFVTVLPPDPPLWLIALILLNVLLVECLWYLLVAVFFSARVPREAYVRSRTTVDRVMAVLLGALGLKLLADARNV
jgi:threonine/homoserine/homoserine lactone efflux protein